MHEHDPPTPLRAFAQWSEIDDLRRRIPRALSEPAQLGDNQDGAAISEAELTQRRASISCSVHTLVEGPIVDPHGMVRYRIDYQ